MLSPVCYQTPSIPLAAPPCPMQSLLPSAPPLMVLNFRQCEKFWVLRMPRDPGTQTGTRGDDDDDGFVFGTGVGSLGPI
eukprot:495222-Rhodomonas_salina.1